MFFKNNLKTYLCSLTHLHKQIKQAGEDVRGKKKRSGGPKGSGNVTSQDILIILIVLVFFFFFFFPAMSIVFFSGRITSSVENMATRDFSLGLWLYL